MKNIIETAVGNPEFSTLVTALKAAGLIETLSGTGSFTVFAPTDAAFEKIPKETLNAVLADTEKLSSILTYHVVSGKMQLEDLEEMTEVKTVEGSEIHITEEDDDAEIMINNAYITSSDIECSNGVIHLIDTVLMP